MPNTQGEKLVYSRKQVAPVAIGVMAISVAVMLLMQYLQPVLLANAANGSLLSDFGTWIGGAMSGSFSDRVMWFLGDYTEGTFIKSVPASVLMIVFTFISCHLEKKKSKYAGTGVGGNSSIYLKMFGIATVSMIICQLVYDPIYFSNGWIPTFTPFIVSQVFVLFYGLSLAKVITIIAAASFVPFLLAFYASKMVASLGLPPFVPVAFGMMVTVLLCTELFRFMPWMTRDPLPAPAPQAPATSIDPKVERRFFVTRIFGDLGECVLTSSSWGSVGMYLGLVLSWCINPLHGVYGAGGIPVLICVQVCTAALAIFIFYPKYRTEGFAVTFPSILCASAIATTYPNTIGILIPTILVSALAFDPLVSWLMKVTNYKGRWHVIVYVLFAICTITTAWSFVVMKLLMPLVG